MTLRLTVLGGSAAWPNPGQGCSAYLVESRSTRVLLDCGPDTLHELRRQIDFRLVDAVVLSHLHADHMLDLVPYRYGLKYGFLRPTRLIPLFVPPGGEARLSALAGALAFGSESSSGFWSDVFDVRESDPSQQLSIGDLRLSFAATQHFVPCFAIRVAESAGASLGYTADTGSIEPLVEHLRGVSLLLAEATERDHGDRPVEDRGHLTPEDAGRLASRANVQHLMLTHLWHERPRDEVVKRAALEFNGPITVSEQGLRFDVE